MFVLSSKHSNSDISPSEESKMQSGADAKFVKGF